MTNATTKTATCKRCGVQLDSKDALCVKCHNYIVADKKRMKEWAKYLTGGR